MKNFFFHNPTKIIFGRDTINQIGAETAKYGKKALLVYGKQSIHQTGIYEKVINSLKDARITTVTYGGVQPNPLLSHVRAGINLARKEKIDVIVAVGGGSVIDSAKAISCGVMASHDLWQFFKGKQSIKKTLPLTCVLTLSGAGSEMNSGMVITNEEKKQKIGIGNKLLNPKLSILDPTATFTVPATHTAYGAIDSIAHLLEFYFTAEDNDTEVQDRLTEGLAISIIKSCHKALKNPNDYQGRAAMMWSATLSLNGLTAAGLGKTSFPMHMIEHSLSALYDVPHGAGLSVVLPGWMTWQAANRPQKIAQFATRVMNVSSGSTTERAIAGIKRLKEWFTEISCPTTLHDLNIPTQDIPDIAANALTQAKVWRLNQYSQEKIENILKLCI